MKRTIFFPVILVGVIGFLAARADAVVLVLGWADEFVLGWVDCTTDTPGCSLANLYRGRTVPELSNGPRTWEFIGTQGTTGRANSRSKAMFRWEQLSGTTCASTTVTITRFKVVGGTVLVGDPCTAGTQSQVAVSSQTFQDCTAGEGKIQQRLLPVLDFTSETAGAGDINYKETLSLTTPNTSASQAGCFKIRWF